MALTSGVTSGLKSAVDRPRPTGSGQSFPSGHASNTSVCDTLSARNVDDLGIPDGARLGLKIGFTALTVSTAWARVEARQHYPSDVLGGMALGHFLGAFINDAFFGTKTPKNFFFSVEPSKKDIYLQRVLDILKTLKGTEGFTSIKASPRLVSTTILGAP